MSNISEHIISDEWQDVISEQSPQDVRNHRSNIKTPSALRLYKHQAKKLELPSNNQGSIEK